ncbi:putative divalent heavy-metal cations transporter [Candidatus Methanoperedens nitroreducens]|uniref:Putative divalent heavy-metal cations transporter n=2 Tax=Candidatus Methanoperedens nitratireducens TaxID=1392998 RepID=A0A062V639_9EURY|nr:putative divalent heavy-metal cations transporter [Candidatus Methanoperedens nitroreducens]
MEVIDYFSGSSKKMIDFFQNLEPVTQALLGTVFTWGMTALGASAVFMSKDISKRALDGMLGFAGGVMISASFFSLLAPAIEMSEGKDIPAWFPAVVGFLVGGIFLGGIDKVLPHLHFGSPIEKAEGIKTTWKRSTLLILAITLHNIPEGLAIGVAFGAVATGFPSATLPAAIALAVGIGIQNFPEGLAVSMPLKRDGMSSLKSFWYGQLSAIVEPIAAVLGAIAVNIAKPVLPYALGFAAGAMIFVVVEEVIPESQNNGNADLATMGAMVGFAIMMVLDVASG